MRAPLTVVLTLLASIAAADIIYMADGTRREGRIVQTTDTEVIVDVGLGAMSLQVRIPRADIARIERKQSSNDLLMADYVGRLAKARQGTAHDWHALGAWCTQQRVFKAQARQAYLRAIAIDPDHGPAHAALGHVKLNDAWMTRQQAIALLAPDLASGALKARELAAQKQAEEAKAQAIEAQARLAQLEGAIAQLQRDNDALRQRLAIPPPPPDRYRPRVIYRPIIIQSPRGRKHDGKHDGKRDGKRDTTPDTRARPERRSKSGTSDDAKGVPDAAPTPPPADDAGKSDK